MLIFIINEGENSLLSMDFRKSIYLCPAGEGRLPSLFEVEKFEYVIMAGEDEGRFYPPPGKCDDAKAAVSRP